MSVAGIPSLGIPVADTARGHQVETARRFAAGSGCLLREERDWDGATLASEIGGVLRDAGEWEKRAKGMRRAFRRDDVVDLADDCRRLIAE